MTVEGAYYSTTGNDLYKGNSLYEKAISIDPTYSLPLRLISGNYWVLMAKANDPQMRSEYYSKGMKYTEQLISINRDDPDGYY